MFPERGPSAKFFRLLNTYVQLPFQSHSVAVKIKWRAMNGSESKGKRQLYIGVQKPENPLGTPLILSTSKK